MTDIWTPLSTRNAVGPALREELSPALEQALRVWIEQVAASSPSLVDRVLLRCDMARDFGTEDVDDAEFLAWRAPTETVYDVVDAVLDLLPTGGPAPSRSEVLSLRESSTATVALAAIAAGLTNMQFSTHRSPLKQLLEDGRSVYTLRKDGRALVRRVDPTLNRLVDGAAEAAQQPDRGSASTHLRRAYDSAYALHPDPVRAYSEAIKAVEAAAHAVIQPNNRKATLGTMLGQIPQIAHKLKVVLPGKTGDQGLETVRSMMELLWTGQTSRHGGQQPTASETTEQAQMAVDLATLLVRWFSTGAVSRC